VKTFPLAAARGRDGEWRIGRQSLMCVLLLLICWQGARAQAQKETSTYEGFEGRRMSSVNLAAKPTMDVEQFRPLLKLKAGEPLSTAALRESVEALKNTRQFSRVQVKLEPQQDGIRVLFILQPAYYLGMVFFPGATKVYSYTQLLQIVNIPEQTVFADDSVPQAEGALINFFKRDGFFTATVRPEVQRDDAHRVVNVTFHCDLKQRAKIARIEIQGATPEQEADVRHTLTSWWAKLKTSSLKPGQRYSQAKVRKSIDFIRGHLQKQGYITSIVRLASSEYQSESKRTNVTLDVEPGPRVSIKVVGAHLWNRTLKKLIPIYEENAVDADLVAEGERNLVSYFQGKSYLDVQVSSQLDQKPGDIKVLYRVKRGAKHNVVGVHFEGNRYFSDKQLQAHVMVTKEKPTVYRALAKPLASIGVVSDAAVRGSFSKELLKKSVASLTALYKNEGFPDVKVHGTVQDHEPEIDVTFSITEGEQDEVNSLQIVNDERQPVQPPGDRPVNLSPGKPYSPKLLQDDRNQVLAQYLNNGYWDAHFDSKISREPAQPHLIDVQYTIHEGPQTHIGEIALLGADHTKPNFIQSITNANVTHGAPLSQGKLLVSESDLYSLGVFDWATVGPLKAIEGQASEEVLVKVHEAKRNTLDVGGGVEVLPRAGNIPTGAVTLPGLPSISLGSKFQTSQKSFWGPRVSMNYSRRDLRGKAETASIGFVLSRLDQRGSITYSDPRLRGTTWSSLFSLSGERTSNNPIFTAELGQASLQFERYLDSKHSKTLRARYSYQRTYLSNITIPQLVLPEDQRVKLSSVYGEYLRDTRDNALDAHHGMYQTFSFGVSPSALGSSSNFVRFLGRTSFYFPIKPWLTWANNFRVGFAPPFANSRVPLSERFFTGGPDTLRGFAINAAGPQRPITVCSNPADASTCSIISVPVGGLMLAIVNTEGRFPIPLKQGLSGAVFYDGGNVYSHINFSEFVSNFSHSIGFGIRYRTPVGPIRVDIGHDLSPLPGLKATQYFITLGQAF
jgi:outer membrane protein insertion porin family